MGRRVFVDTNVFVYLYDEDSDKRERAIEVINDEDLDLVVSTQVLNEFYVTVTRKIAKPLSASRAQIAVNSLAELEVVPITRNLVVDAIATAIDHQLSHWDALMIEAAARSGTEELMTEVMSDGATLRGVSIVNPFAASENPVT